MIPGLEQCPTGDCPFGMGPEDLHWLYEFTPEDRVYIEGIAALQDANSGARGTRSAGKNLNFRRYGCYGEFAAARILGIEPQIRALPGPDLGADIIHPNGLEIEVKTGFPQEARSKINRKAVYMMGRMGNDDKLWHLTAITLGWRIEEHAVDSPEEWEWRKGSRFTNWRVLDFSTGQPRLVN